MSALALEPSILLIDKPCNALDPSASAVVEELIQHNCYTVVIETHNLAQARRVANYAAFFWMADPLGKLIMKAISLKTHPAQTRIFPLKEK